MYIENNGFEKVAHAVLDTASSRSYISKFVANTMELKRLRKLKITHGLCGGIETTVNPNCYFIYLRCLSEIKSVKIEAMEQVKICDNVPKNTDINCMIEWKGKNNLLSDIFTESKNRLSRDGTKKVTRVIKNYLLTIDIKFKGELKDIHADHFPP